jgi:hypothetical protein
VPVAPVFRLSRLSGSCWKASRRIAGRRGYPAMTLELVHGALVFYGEPPGVHAYCAEGQRLAEAQQGDSRQNNARLIAKLRRVRP